MFFTQNSAKKVILLWTLVLTSFFGLIIFSITQLKYIFIAILLYFAYKSKKDNVPLSKVIYWYLFFVICSCAYSAYFNGQNFVRVFVYSYDYLGILFCFLIMKFRPSSIQLEKVIIILSITFCCCYLFQWLIFPVQFFSGASDELNITESTFRMRMPCSICAYCLFFLGINKYILYRKFKYILYSLLGLIPVFIMGFRSLTVGMVFFAIVMIHFVTKRMSKTVVWLILGFIAAIYISQLSIVQDKIDEMVERQNSGQTFENKDYIRFIEYDYFTTTIFSDPLERIIGGGVPCEISSPYYKGIMYASEKLHFYWVDLGLVGLSFVIGIPAVLLLSFIAIMVIRKAKSVKYQYIRFTVLTVFLASIITSMELFRSGNLIILSLYVCMLYCYDRENISTCRY